MGDMLLAVIVCSSVMIILLSLLDLRRTQVAGTERFHLVLNLVSVAVSLVALVGAIWMLAS